MTPPHDTHAPPYLLGLDIGGTKIGVSLGTPQGKVLGYDRVPVDAQAPPEEVLGPALERLRTLGRDHGDALESSCGQWTLGAACPGPMSSREGRFLDPPNMPRWHGFALEAFLKRQLGIAHVAMMNDANATALAEWRWGAARGTSTAVYFTMSTGMGAGLIIGDRLHPGADDLAGEIGHIRLDPDGPVGFGKRGSVEGYLSGPGILQLAAAEARLAQQIGEPSVLLASASPLTTQDVCHAAHTGDPAARRAMKRSATALGRLMALLTDLLNPEIFVLGTIGSAWPALFIPRAREVLEREALSRAAHRVRIVPSGLGPRRGDLSALAVAAHAVDLMTDS